MPSGIMSCTEKFERRKLEKRSWSWLSTSLLHAVSQVSSEVAGGLTTIVAARAITLQNKT